MTNDIHIANGHNQNNNHHKLIGWLLLLLCLAIILLSGCSVELQDQKALNRVEAKPDLINAAATQWLKNHPPIIDTETVYVKGKTEYVPVIKTVVDFEAIKKAVDSVKSAIKIPKCDSAIEIAYNEGYNDALANHPNEQRVDTAKKTKVDARALDMANDTITKLRLTLAGMNGQILSAHNATLDVENTLSKYKWGIGIFIFLVLGFTAFKIFAKNNPATATANASSNILTTILNKIKGK